MNLIAEIEQDYFDEKSQDEKDATSLKVFGIPSPNFLNVTLSADSCKKIKHLYHMMIQEDLTKVEFFISSPSVRRGNFPPKPHEINSFFPMRNDEIISQIEYLDFGEVFFNVFETKCSRITLDKFENKIKFQFIYSNSWTEEVFCFTYQLDKLINFIN